MASLALAAYSAHAVGIGDVGVGDDVSFGHRRPPPFVERYPSRRRRPFRQAGLDRPHEQLGRVSRIVCAIDRPADHQIVRAGGDRLLGRGNARLIAGRVAGQSDARRHDRHPGPDDRAHAGRLVARGDDALASGLPGEPGAAGNEIGGRGGDALLAQIGSVEVGEHGDAQDAEGRAGLAGHRGAQRLEVERMYGQERGADGGRIAGGALHRVLDVEQLHVQEHALAVAHQLAREIEAAAHGELEPDLVETDRVSELGDQRARLLDASARRGRRSAGRVRRMPAKVPALL